MANKNIGTVEEITTVQQKDTVLVETGGSLKRISPDNLGKSINMLSSEDSNSYGVEIDPSVSSPDLARIGNAELHRSLPVQSKMRGCLLSDDGTVAAYLPSDSWVGSTLDGTKGQVMVEVPEHWMKYETVAGKLRVRTSAVELQGYTHVQKYYVGAYEAAVDRTNNKLCSVKNTTAQYRGGNNDSKTDGTAKTQLGMPATGLSLASFRNYARARKTGSTEWNAMPYTLYADLYWLFVTEYATLNSQAPYNGEPTAEGYRQGGLGDGVTTLDWGKWNTLNGTYPVIRCGYTDELGNGTGVKDYTMPTEYGEDGKKVSVPRYRGIENPFGHLLKKTDGILVEVNPTEENGGNGLSRVLVCEDPAKFADTPVDGYNHIGNEDREGGFVKEILFGDKGYILPKTCTGGSSSTYFCDNHSVNVKNTAVEVRGVLFGGAAYNGSSAGFAFASSNYAPSNSNPSVGSRLCFFATA